MEPLITMFDYCAWSLHTAVVTRAFLNSQGVPPKSSNIIVIYRNKPTVLWVPYKKKPPRRQLPSIIIDPQLTATEYHDQTPQSLTITDCLGYHFHLFIIKLCWLDAYQHRYSWRQQPILTTVSHHPSFITIIRHQPASSS